MIAGQTFFMTLYQDNFRMEACQDTIVWAIDCMSLAIHPFPQKARVYREYRCLIFHGEDVRLFGEKECNENSYLSRSCFKENG